MVCHEGRFGIATQRRHQWVEITDRLGAALRESGVRRGQMLVFVPHTTAGVSINENADPDVLRDVTGFLDRLIPDRPEFTHAEGNSDAHIKASLVGASETLMVREGRLALGRWQGVYFCEFDGPRQRTVEYQILSLEDAGRS